MYKQHSDYAIRARVGLVWIVASLIIIVTVAAPGSLGP